jgi:hypothetical protein
MKWNRIFSILLSLAVVLGLLPMLAVAAPVSAPPANVEQSLLDQFTADGTADFVVVFAEQADLSPAYSMDWNARGEFVYNTLKETAARTQVQAKAYLDGAGLTYQTFIAGNELYVWAGNLTAATALADLPEVDHVRATRTAYIDPIVEAEAAMPDAPSALDWGIVDTHADQFWATFGYQGDGIVVSNIDTGVQWDHPALDQAYKCPGDPTNSACWYDPSNTCGGTVCDNNGHGTHTMGTMVGDDDPALTWQAGMAPNAQFIMCKGCESTSCSEASLNACADWILAPGGNTANRPNIVNNSWGGDGCDTWYQAKVQAWRASGIFPAFSSGNSTGCGSMGSPGDYQESFASTGHDSSRNHAWSQGPSCFGDDPYTKPNITAPSIAVCSSVPTNAWSCGYSGTSMASPHSAGAVALLWSCDPALIGDLDATFEALQNTADPPDPVNPTCGAPADGEGTYEDGYGYLNVYEAGLMYCNVAGLGHLDGFVTQQGTGDPIEGASVAAFPAVESGNNIEATTDPTGYYTMTLMAGTYDVTASKNGYTSQTVYDVVVYTDTVTSQDFELAYLGQWSAGPSNAPFQYNRFDGVFDPVDNLIYFPGGRTGGSTHDKSIWTYDPANDVWADTTCDMLYNAANITAVLIPDDGTGRGEAIYVIGGYDVAVALNIDDVQRYYPSQPGCVVEDLPNDLYPDLAPNSLPVGAPGVAEVDGKIYVFGGWDSALPYFSSHTWVFDPLAADGSRWTQLADMSVARSYIQAAAQGDMVYALGGHTSYAGSDLVPTTLVEVLDTHNLGAGWATLADMPVASAEGRGFGFQSDTLGLDQPAGKIYVVGGGDWPDFSGEAMEYDVATDTWNQDFPDLIAGRRDHAGVYVPLCTPDPTDGLPGMWVFGGHTAGDDPPFGNPEFYPFPCAFEPVASFDADPAAGCAPLDVSFTDTSSGMPAEWLWDFGDGVGTSTEQNPDYTYTLPGDFVVTLVVSNTAGSDTVTGTVSVYETPQAAFTFAPSLIYTDTAVQFTDTSTGPVAEWFWDFDDGYTDSVSNPMHTFLTAGTFTVTLTVTSAMGCVDTTFNALDVVEQPAYQYIYLPIVVKNN